MAPAATRAVAPGREPARSLRYLADIPVTRLRGVGDKHADALASVGVTSVADLLTYFPRRYVDRSRQCDIASLSDSEEATVVATVRRVQSRRTRQGRSLVEIDLFDGTSYLRLTFFNQAWRARQLPEGTPVVVWGRVERFQGRRQMTNPVVDLVGDRTGRIIAIYPQSEKAGLTSAQIGAWVGEALGRVPALADPLPAEHLDRLDLVGRDWAIRAIHGPESAQAASVARRRLAFDELLRLQLVLVLRKRSVEAAAAGICHRVDGPVVAAFGARLPFALTGAQRRAVEEIRADMAAPVPMHRLLQGDVGSGKTLVALDALLVAVDGGHQGALMAPTEVLAEQHHRSVCDLVAGLRVPAGEGSLLEERPLRVALLTSRTTARARAALLRDVAEGEVDVLVGTHALLTDAVAFRSLGMVVVDEQHRFGVEQRATLRDKGSGVIPDVLVMTATPIPRTAAMTVYGDLDTTVLDELPPGRTPITTVWARGPLEESEAWACVRGEVRAGRQAYVVCPLVEGSERVQARSAAEEHARLSETELVGLRVGLLHGQLPERDKDAVMQRFRAGELDVLVATTVVEVGVDVPNATVMVIEDADRFGIAQLHQLRGRVGRGSSPSWCYLIGGSSAQGATGADGAARLEALERSTDGFELAEVDLELRGEGTILGARQKGTTDLKLASLRRDRELVGQARDVAFALVDADPGLRHLPALAEEIAALVDDDDREYLFKS